MNRLLKKGFLATLFASFSYGLQSIFFRYIGTDFGVFYPFVVRALIIAGILFAYLFFTKTLKKIQKKHWKWFVAMPVAGVITFVTIFIAINNIPVGTTLFLHYASLAVTGFILGYVMFQEKMNRLKLIALALSVIGLFLIFTVPELQKSVIYLLLALISGVASSLWYIFSKNISDTYSSVQIIAVDSLFAFVFTFAFALLYGETLYSPALSFEWFAVLGMTLTSLFGFVFTIYGFRYLQAHIASLVLLMEVVFGVILAWVLLQEVPTTQVGLGGILILAGVALSYYGEAGAE